MLFMRMGFMSYIRALENSMKAFEVVEQVGQTANEWKNLISGLLFFVQNLKIDQCRHHILCAPLLVAKGGASSLLILWSN